ncbi:MAG: NAD(P)H-dependent oxidoreductase, partial [Mycetocola sp.]
MDSPLTALALVCTLTASPERSSSDLLADQFLTALASHGVAGNKVRVVDHNVRPGVHTDMGEGDAWPAIREKVLAADILLVSTPTWAGHMSSVASRVVERLDAELSETDAAG